MHLRRKVWTNSKVVEESSAEIEITVTTTRALIPHDSVGSFAAVRDGYGPTAVGSGISTAELRRVESDDEV